MQILRHGEVLATLQKPSAPIHERTSLPPMPALGRPRRYRIREMRVGDSFYVPPGRIKHPAKTLRRCIANQMRGLPIKTRFTVTREGEGWRCRRVQ